MFYYLEGTVGHMEAGLCVLDVGGVGYAVNTSLNTLASLKIGERKRLYTSLHIREEAAQIYGFLTQEELRSFLMLLSISGVGPKAALSILSAATPEKLALSIITGDEKLLTAAPGIGKKIAQRIILELKDKVQKEQVSAGLAGAGAPVAFTSNAAEALTALGVLGYSQAEAAAAIRGIDTEALPVSEIVRLGLKSLGGGK